MKKEITTDDLKKLEKKYRGKSEEEIMTTIKLNRKAYIEVKKMLLENEKTFKDWVNTKMEEELENGSQKPTCNRNGIYNN